MAADAGRDHRAETVQVTGYAGNILKGVRLAGLCARDADRTFFEAVCDNICDIAVLCRAGEPPCLKRFCGCMHHAPCQYSLGLQLVYEVIRELRDHGDGAGAVYFAVQCVFVSGSAEQIIFLRLRTAFPPVFIIFLLIFVFLLACSCFPRSILIPQDRGDCIGALTGHGFAVPPSFRCAQQAAIRSGYRDRTSAADRSRQPGYHFRIAAHPDTDQFVLPAVHDQGVCVACERDLLRFVLIAHFHQPVFHFILNRPFPFFAQKKTIQNP